MLGYLFYRWTLCWIKCYHSSKYIHKTLVEIIHWTTSRMCLPKCTEVFLFYQLVIWVIWHCFLKRWVTSVHYKQYYTCCEYIHLCTVVVFARDLWSHVPLSSKFSMQNPTSIFSSQQAREAKISKFKNKISAQKYILRFNIPMCISFRMHIM